MSEEDFKELSSFKEAGSELDLQLALLMGWKHWSGDDLSLKLEMEKRGGRPPETSVPRFSTDHNAFFEHVATYFVNQNMEFIARYLVQEQMWQVEIKTEKRYFYGDGVRTALCWSTCRYVRFNKKQVRVLRLFG